MRFRSRIIVALASSAVALATAAAPALAAGGVQSMHRLYNPYSGEHFYTASTDERDHLTSIGWSYEGVGWVAPAEGDDVYRMYNPYSGDHHYTTSATERDSLVGVGWQDEGVGWRSGGDVAIMRQYNPYAITATHNYTMSAEERNMLVGIGWRDEGVAWYGMGARTADDAGQTYAPDAPDLPMWVKANVNQLRAATVGRVVRVSDEEYRLRDVGGEWCCYCGEHLVDQDAVYEHIDTHIDREERATWGSGWGTSFSVTPRTYWVQYHPNHAETCGPIAANGWRTAAGTSQLYTMERGESAALDTSFDLHRNGYEFAGWNTSEDGSGKAYADGQVVRDLAAPGERVVLWAQWRKTYAGTYTIMYLSQLVNAGRAERLLDYKNETVTAGVDYVIPECNLTAPSWVHASDGTPPRFAGWKTEDGTLYQPGDVVRDLAESAGQVKLYAVWD